MVTLLHLSDLHFGYDGDKAASAQRAGVLGLLVKELRGIGRDWKPDVLVISGDLTCRGKASGYGELAKWLREEVFPATGLTAADCVICPGNHDLDRDEASALLDRTQDTKRADEVLRPEKLARGFARPFSEFVKFAEGFGIPAPLLHGESNYLVGVREVRGIQFVCLNSAWFCRDSNTDRGQLWLGLPQLEALLADELREYDDGPLRVAVVHHPQDWFANSECHDYDDRPGSYAYLAQRAQAILSGHTHGSIELPTRCYDRARLFLSGAAYDSHQYRNNFALLKVDIGRRSVERRAWELDPRGPVWEEKKRGSYSLRTERPVSGVGNPDKYLAWLRGETESINLHQLKVEPGKTPPPGMDVLYMKLMTSARAGEGEAMGRAEAVPLEEALKHRKLVIEGKPGGGKTTFVRWIAWMLCRPAGPPAELPVRGFALWIRISELDQYIWERLKTRGPADPELYADGRWIPQFLASRGWGLDEAFFQEKLAAEDTVLLLDGLDEAANQARRIQMVALIQLAAAQCEGHVVVTTRPGAHEGKTTLDRFEKATIDDLDDAGIDRFLLQWCRWLKRDDEAAAQGYYVELRPAVAVPSIHILARNPLMLTALAVLHLRRHRLPQQRAQLYEQIMDWLADQAVERHPEYPKDELLGRFGKLAVAMQEWKGGQKVQLGLDDAAQVLTAPDQPIEPARRFLELAQVHSGIVTLRGGEIAFWHRSFQEYLVARTLSGFPDTKLWAGAVPFLYSAEGREVLPLLAGCMAGSARERLDNLFERLVGDAVGQKELERKAHAVGVLGNMLSDVAPANYALSGAAQEQYRQLRARVMVIFEKGKARDIGLKTRVAAAEALDQASQARLCTPGDADYWVEIVGKQGVPMPTFRIGRFPVTVWEYGKYLDETGGVAPLDWDEQVTHSSRPVVYVTWHDAEQYCEWASGKWGIQCKLPDERQWEFAARGHAGRVYPWGPEEQEPDENRANFMELGLRAPTPVGMFPDGHTPECVADMAGNVWELTRSDYDKDNKVVRGASFDDAATNLRAGFRFRVEPGNDLDYIGFRCVRE